MRWLYCALAVLCVRLHCTALRRYPRLQRQLSSIVNVFVRMYVGDGPNMYKKNVNISLPSYVRFRQVEEGIYHKQIKIVFSQE